MTTQKGNTIFIHILNKVEGGEILLPFTDRKITKVEVFAGGTRLKFQRDKEGVRIQLPEQTDGVDFILKATMK